MAAKSISSNGDETLLQTDHSNIHSIHADSLSIQISFPFPLHTLIDNPLFYSYDENIVDARF